MLAPFFPWTEGSRLHSIKHLRRSYSSNQFLVMVVNSERILIFHLHCFSIPVPHCSFLFPKFTSLKKIFWWCVVSTCWKTVCGGWGKGRAKEGWFLSSGPDELEDKNCLFFFFFFFWAGGERDTVLNREIELKFRHVMVRYLLHTYINENT